jgi:hypothetical protein
MRRTLSPLQKLPQAPRTLAPKATGLRLLTREEVSLVSQIFDRFKLVTREDLSLEEAFPAGFLNEAAFPNLKALCRDDNAPFLAYLRFAPRPLVQREFFHMLCPAADDRELDLFQVWAREGRGLLVGAGPAPMTRAEAASPQVQPSASTTKFKVLRGIPDRPERPQSRVDAGETQREAQGHVKRFVQQRYLELMMLEGMDPNAACAKALQEAPACAPGAATVSLSAGLGHAEQPTEGISARSVCAS